MIRCAIIHLVGLAGLLGMGMAALFRATPLWLSLSTSLLVAAFMVSALAARFGSGSVQSFAAGYLITAGLYAAIVFTSLFPELARTLPTSRLNDRLVASMHPDQIAQPTAPASNPATLQTDLLLLTELSFSTAVRAGAPGFPLPYRFAGIAQVLWTLLIGIVGGDAAVWIRRRRTGLSPVRAVSES